MIVRAIVFAGAKKEYYEVDDAGRVRVFVREPAERNLANRRVREILAQNYQVSIGSVTLRTGHRSPHKTFEINNL